MRIFDELDRDYHGPARYREGEFSYLNRSARPAAGEVRAVVEKFFENYCGKEKATLRDRFRTDFWSAFFELVLHEYLRRIAESVDCHPDIGTSGKRPDFLATFSNGDKVVVEAVLSFDVRNDGDARPSTVEASLLDAVNEVDSPNFFLGIREIVNPEGRQPSGRKIRAFLEREMSKLDPGDTERRIEMGEPIPSLVFVDGSFQISFDLAPRSLEIRGDRSIRPIGIGPIKTRWGGSAKALRSTIGRKAREYGQLGIPYVLAINCLSQWGLDEADVMEALFGTKKVFVRRGETECDLGRAPDGIWLGPNGPQNTRLSSLLVARLLPWNIPSAEFHLIHNIWAKFPACHIPWKVKSETPGDSLGTILGLPSSWPGDLFERA